MFAELLKFIFITFLLNPMILCGAAVGLYVMRYYGFEYMQYIVLNKPLMLLPPLLAFGYAMIFTHVYYPESKRVNWTATALKTFRHLLVLVLSAACTCFIIYAINNISGKKLDDYLRYKNRPVSTIVPENVQE